MRILAGAHIDAVQRRHSPGTLRDRPRRSARAAWARSTRRATRGSTAPSPSRCCRRRSSPTPQCARAVRARGARHRGAEPSAHLHALRRRPPGRRRLPRDGVPRGRDAAPTGSRAAVCRSSRRCDCAIEIADALDSAHRAGIVHRDLKPGNIMLTTSRREAARLRPGEARGAERRRAGPSDVDTRAAESPAQGAIIGTLQYMAPEQVEGREADARTRHLRLRRRALRDGDRPAGVRRATQAALIAAILYADPPPPSSIVPALSPAFDHFVRRCLAKNPDDRWQSAHDVLLELRWLEQERLLVAPPRRRRPRRRSNAAGSRALAVALAALAGNRVPPALEPDRACPVTGRDSTWRCPTRSGSTGQTGR